MSRASTASAAGRLVGVALIGIVAGAAAAFVSPAPVALLVGWDTAALALLVWVWGSVRRFSADDTARFATREDDTRVGASLALVGASVAGLLGAGLAMLGAGHLEGAERTALLVVCTLAVFLSWGVVQTEFALRYAHEYYRDTPGGIDFGGPDGPPDYQDFAYFAVTIGMTFQTSDATIGSRRIRRIVLRHALLAYVFGAVIVAVMVNVIAGLIR